MLSTTFCAAQWVYACPERELEIRSPALEVIDRQRFHLEDKYRSERPKLGYQQFRDLWQQSTRA